MRRWRILTLGKTEILLHPMTVACLGYGLLTGHGGFVAIAYASVLVHEAAHAAAALLCGQPPACVELSPLGAVMRLEDDERLPPLRRCFVLIAGPGATFLLCWLSLHIARRGLLDAEISRQVFTANLSILALNLLPVLPLDGGRLTALVCRIFMPPRMVSRILQIVTTVFGFGLILLNLWSAWRLGSWNLSLAFAGCCMIYSAATANLTSAMEELRYFIERKISLERRGLQRAVCIAALHTQPVRRVLKRLPRSRCAVFCCLEAGTMRTLGWMTEFELVQRYLQQPGVRLGDCLGKASIPGANRD